MGKQNAFFVLSSYRLLFSHFSCLGKKKIYQKARPPQTSGGANTPDDAFMISLEMHFEKFK